MSFFPQTVADRQQAKRLGLAIVLLPVTFFLFFRFDIQDAATSLPAAVQWGGAILVLLAWVGSGWRFWKRMPDLGELELRIQTEAAFLTQHVTGVALVIIMGGILLYGDAFPTPTLLTLAIGYIYLTLISGWLAKRRYE
jgi:hypothetical protein